MTGNHRTIITGKLLLAVLLIAVLLAGCSGPTPTIAPTVDQIPTFSAIQTEAARTVVAELTRNAPTATAEPTETPAIPTEIPAPTETPAEAVAVEPTPVPPTATATRAVVVFVPTNTLTPTQAAYRCSIVEQSPASGAQFAKNAEFDLRWKIKNTGTQSWDRNSVDLKYVSGDKLQKYGDVYDLPESVNPDGNISLLLDMIAPNATGRSSATWALVQDGVTICTMTVTINVQ